MTSMAPQANSSFVHSLEVCNMINVKYVPPHRRVTKEKPKKEEEPNKKEAKKEIEVVASINGDVGSRSSVRFWITLVVGGARHTDPTSDPKTRIQQS